MAQNVTLALLQKAEYAQGFALWNLKGHSLFPAGAKVQIWHGVGVGTGTEVISPRCVAFVLAVAVEHLGSCIMHLWKMKSCCIPFIM
jgi:hypothetical protein